MNELFNIIGIPGILVTVIASLLNLVITRNSNKLIKKIEKYDEINKYRYTEINKILVEISLLEGINYAISNEEDTKITVQKLTERFENIKKKYVVVKSLLSENYTITLDSLFHEEKKMSNELVSYGYTGTEPSYEFKELLILRQKIEHKLVNILQSQIAELINC